MVVASGDQAVAAEEAAMVVSVDPTVCPLSAFLSADEAAWSESSPAPMSSVPDTPLMPRRDFVSAAESSSSVSQRRRKGCEVREPDAERDADVDGGESVSARVRSRRIAGRKQAVAVDDSETQTSMSITSVDEDDMMAASSSRTRNKGVKRNRETVKDRN